MNYYYLPSHWYNNKKWLNLLKGIKLYGESVYVTGRRHVGMLVTYSYSVALAAIAGNESDSEAC